MRRLLAVVGAVAMVAGSLAIRARLDRTEEERAQELRLVCAAELEPVCRALQEGLGDDVRLMLTFERAGSTADRLTVAAGLDAGLDGWLVTAPWPANVDARRRNRALPEVFAPLRAPVARSPLVVVVWKDRSAALAPHCRDARVRWECLGAFAGDPWTTAGGSGEWGSVRPGLADPVSDDIGLLVLGQAVADYFGRGDNLATADLDNDDGFQGWFAGLAETVRRPAATPSPLRRMLTFGRAEYAAVGTVEAEAGPLLLRAASRSEVDVLYPAPVVTADLVLAEVGDSPEGRRLAELLAGEVGKKALAEAGWRVDDEPVAEGISDDPLPAASNLPPPGLLDALRFRWQDSTG